MDCLGEFKILLDRLKELLLARPGEILFLDDIARILDMTVSDVERLYEIMLDINGMTFHVTLDREIRGKYMLYEPDELDGSDYLDEDEDLDDLV